MIRFFTLLLVISLTPLVSAEVYQWRDASGRLVFGDNPPDPDRAKVITLPELTVADGYQVKKQKVAAVPDKDKEEDAEEYKYTYFEIDSPSDDEAIRANSGQLSLSIDLEPRLKKGHSIVFYLDGKRVSKGSSTSTMVKDVSRGQHSLFAVLLDENEDLIRNTDSITFHLLRKSAI